jgi:hypothetical protein
MRMRGPSGGPLGPPSRPCAPLPQQPLCCRPLGPCPPWLVPPVHSTSTARRRRRSGWSRSTSNSCCPCSCRSCCGSGSGPSCLPPPRATPNAPASSRAPSCRSPRARARPRACPQPRGQQLRQAEARERGPALPPPYPYRAQARRGARNSRARGPPAGAQRPLGARRRFYCWQARYTHARRCTRTSSGRCRGTSDRRLPPQGRPAAASSQGSRRGIAPPDSRAGQPEWLCAAQRAQRPHLVLPCTRALDKRTVSWGCKQAVSTELFLYGLCCSHRSAVAPRMHAGSEQARSSFTCSCGSKDGSPRPAHVRGDGDHV